GRDEVPPVRVRAIAMDQQQARLRAIAPGLVVDARAFAFDEMRLVGRGDGVGEPLRRRRRRAVIRRKRPLFGRNANRLVADDLVFFLGHARLRWGGRRRVAGWGQGRARPRPSTDGPSGLLRMRATGPTVV